MREAPAELLDDIVDAHRILVAERVLDAFGHVSLRDPRSESVFWLARARPPSVVTAADFMAFGLNGEPVAATEQPLFAERYIHAAIFAARSDVHAVCHHHSPSTMPFCISDAILRAVTQTGGFLGDAVPLWDSADEFGDTRMLVDSLAQAASLARTLANAPVVLMRGHGATVVGRSVKDVVFKSIYSCREADYLRDAGMKGATKPLSPGELKKLGQPTEPAVERGWSHWLAELRGTDTPG